MNNNNLPKSKWNKIEGPDHIDEYYLKEITNSKTNYFQDFKMKMILDIDYSRPTKHEPLKYISFIEKELFIKIIEKIIAGILKDINEKKDYESLILRKFKKEELINACIIFILKQEIAQIIELIMKHISKSNEKSKRDYFRNKLNYLALSYLRIEGNENYRSYLGSYKLFFSRLIRTMQKYFGIYFPKKMNTTINILLIEDVKEDDNLPIEPFQLKQSIYDPLTQFKDLSGKKNIFCIEEKEHTKTDFKYFLSGDTSKMIEPINILSDIPYRNYPPYIIENLIQFIPLQQQMSIYDSPFLINGRKISDKMAHTAKSRLKYNVDTTLIERIKELFNLHVV